MKIRFVVNRTPYKNPIYKWSVLDKKTNKYRGFFNTREDARLYREYLNKNILNIKIKEFLKRKKNENN